MVLGTKDEVLINEQPLGVISWKVIVIHRKVVGIQPRDGNLGTQTQEEVIEFFRDNP